MRSNRKSALVVSTAKKPAAILVAMLSLPSCYSSYSIVGQADSSTDPWTVPAVDTVSDTITDPAPDIITAVCGNGILEEGEECDDGDIDDCNGCSMECRWERAIEFTDSSAGATIDSGDPFCPTEAFTIEAWFIMDPGWPDCWLFVGENRWFVMWNAEGLRFTDFPCPEECDGFTGPVALDVTPTEGWHHVAITRKPDSSGSGWEFGYFVDGHWRGTRCSSPVDGCGCGPGPESIKIMPHCAGKYDEIRVSYGAIYTGDFTPQRSLTSTSDTFALWTFDQETDGPVLDVSGHGRDISFPDGELVADECHRP